MKNRGDLKTEQQNPNSKNIGTMEIKEILATINNEDSTISSAVKKVIPSIENAVNYFNSFKNTYNDSEFLDEMESKISELSEINNI